MQRDRGTEGASRRPPQSYFGRYLLGARLGAGGMSEVYLARDRVLECETRSPRAWDDPISQSGCRPLMCPVVQDLLNIGEHHVASFSTG